VPASRILLLPSLGTAALLALVARHLWRERRQALLWLLITVHVPMAVFVSASSLAYLGRVGHDPDSYYLIRAYDDLEHLRSSQAAFYATDA
jgi:hypothetical protein